MRATVELLRERGANVTTRDLADAAGVAEGTLFRVFPDKTALICAAIDDALDPAPTVAELAELPGGADLRETLARAVQIMLERARAVGSLLPVLHELRRSGLGVQRPGPPHGTNPAHGTDHAHRSGGHPETHPVEAVVAALVELLQPYHRQLRRTPQTCARMLVALIMVSGRSMGFGHGLALSAEEITELFLDGALTRPATPTEPPTEPLTETSTEETTC